MRNLVVCALMLGLMAGISGNSAPSLLAQTPKKEKDKDAKDMKKDKKSKAAGYIEINEGKDGKFRFNIRNADGKYLGGSGPIGYASEKEAEKAIEELKEIIATAKITKAKAKDAEKKDK